MILHTEDGYEFEVNASQIAEICRSNPCRSQCPNAEPQQVYTCDFCENPIYEGDTYYKLPDDSAVCEDCLTKCIAEVMTSPDGQLSMI